MSSSIPTTFKIFAIAGGLSKASPFSAFIGSHIARALVKEGVQVKILGRTASLNTVTAHELALLGITITEVDYASPASLDAALKGVNVVISALGGVVPDFQLPLADAGKRAGIKLFLPSEFGSNSSTATPAYPAYKKKLFHATLDALNLPYLLVYNGTIAELATPICIGVGNNEIHIVGDGTQPITWTSVFDVADFVAHVLTHTPPNTLLSLPSHALPLEGSRSALLPLARLLQIKHSQAKIVHDDPEIAFKKFQEEGDFMSGLTYFWSQGKGVVVMDEKELGNGLWKGWEAKRKVKAFFFKGC